MLSQITPLAYPSHYPPTDRWKKFFIGVRWLGPDLSFFRDLRAQQGVRTPDLINIWGGGRRQAFAELIGNTLHKRLGWKTRFFLPDDSFQVMCHGPKFGLIDDLFAIEEAIEEIQDTYAVTIPQSFWSGREEATFGEVVDALVVLKDG